MASRIEGHPWSNSQDMQSPEHWLGARRVDAMEMHGAPFRLAAELGLRAPSTRCGEGGAKKLSVPLFDVY